MRRDIEEKTRLAYANENEKAAPGEALAAKIMNMIDVDHGETIAVFYNRTKRPKKEIQEVLAQMEKTGLVKCVDVQHKGNGLIMQKWFSI